MYLNYDVSAAINRIRERLASPTHYAGPRSRDVQRLRLKRLEAGLCCRCGKNPYSPGHGFCAECLEHQKILNRNKRKVVRIHDIERVKEKDRRKRIKLDVIAHYGGKCACCGETEEFFLSADHVNNDGAAHRKSTFKYPGGERKGGTHIYLWIKRNNYPPDFQILCHNCNHGKHLNGGICPHQMKPQLVVSMC